MCSVFSYSGVDGSPTHSSTPHSPTHSLTHSSHTLIHSLTRGVWRGDVDDHIVAVLGELGEAHRVVGGGILAQLILA